ncbi:hypothetical protein D9M68_769170 [compost metagenome]
MTPDRVIEPWRAVPLLLMISLPATPAVASEKFPEKVESRACWSMVPSFALMVKSPATVEALDISSVPPSKLLFTDVPRPEDAKVCPARMSLDSV